MNDHYWNRHTLGCPPALHPWLHDHGSLTRRIQQRCQSFSVQVQSQGLQRIAYDEAALLGIAPRELAHVRDVLLLADGKPVVFAHSVVAARHLRGAWADLGKLGNRSLGTMLFTHPLVERHPLHFRKLHSQHPHYQRASQAANLPDMLWARRSLFSLHGAPLLVTEMFLPDILQLCKG
jgi:chorismate lyase